MHNREAAKAHPVTNGTRTTATRVRHGVLKPDGTIVWRTRSDAQMTDAELDRANAEIERRHRAERISAMLAKTMATPDHWSHK
jgi:hypothetical protein